MALPSPLSPVMVYPPPSSLQEGRRNLFAKNGRIYIEENVDHGVTESRFSRTKKTVARAWENLLSCFRRSNRVSALPILPVQPSKLGVVSWDAATADHPSPVSQISQISHCSNFTNEDILNFSIKEESTCNSFPKSDIHVHFTGALPSETLSDLAAKHGLLWDKNSKKAMSLKELGEGKYEYAHPSQEGALVEEKDFNLFIDRFDTWQEFVENSNNRRLQTRSEVTNFLEFTELYKKFVGCCCDFEVVWDIKESRFLFLKDILSPGVSSFKQMFKQENGMDLDEFKKICTVTVETSREDIRNYDHFHKTVFNTVESIYVRLPFSVMLAPYIEQLVEDKVLLSTPSKGMELVDEEGRPFEKEFLNNIGECLPHTELEDIYRKSGLSSSSGISEESVLHTIELINRFLESVVEDDKESFTIRDYVERSVEYWQNYLTGGKSEDKRLPDHERLMNFQQIQDTLRENFASLNEGQTICEPVPYCVKKTALFFNADINREQNLFRFILDLEIAKRMIEKLPELVVGIVVSGREDHPIAKAQRRLQFLVLAAYIAKYQLNVSIHAGEMTFPQNPTSEFYDVTFEAIQIGAKRLGHVLTYTKMAREKQQEFKRLVEERKICLEMCLSSNECLGFTSSQVPQNHPFSSFLPDFVQSPSPVGVVISTDDPGVFSSNLSNELYKVASTYPTVNYPDIVKMQRDAIYHSFVPGEGIYCDNCDDEYRLKECFIGCQGIDWMPTKEAQEILLRSARAILQVELERRLSLFEETITSTESSNQRSPHSRTSAYSFSTTRSFSIAPISESLEVNNTLSPSQQENIRMCKALSELVAYYLNNEMS